MNANHDAQLTQRAILALLAEANPTAEAVLARAGLTHDEIRSVLDGDADGHRDVLAHARTFMAERPGRTI